MIGLHYYQLYKCCFLKGSIYLSFHCLYYCYLLTQRSNLLGLNRVQANPSLIHHPFHDLTSYLWILCMHGKQSILRQHRKCRILSWVSITLLICLGKHKQTNDLRWEAQCRKCSVWIRTYTLAYRRSSNKSAFMMSHTIGWVRWSVHEYHSFRLWRAWRLKGSGGRIWECTTDSCAWDLPV